MYSDNERIVRWMGNSERVRVTQTHTTPHPLMNPPPKPGEKIVAGYFQVDLYGILFPNDWAAIVEVPFCDGIPLEGIIRIAQAIEAEYYPNLPSEWWKKLRT